MVVTAVVSCEFREEGMLNQFHAEWSIIRILLQASGQT